MASHAVEVDLLAENAVLRRRCAELEAQLATDAINAKMGEKFNQLFHANPDAIVITALEDGQIVDANEAAFDLTGYARDELLSLRTTQLLVEFDDARRQALINRIVQHGTLKDFDLEMQTRQGALATLNLTVCIMEISGTPRLVTFARDVTAQRRIKDILRDSENRYRLLAENVSDVIWMLDLRTGRFTYVSPSVERLHGYAVAEIMQLPLSSVLTPDSLAVVMAALAEARQGGGAAPPLIGKRLELEQVRKDGSTVWTEVMVSSLHDEQGEIVGALGTTRDISERRQQEAAIRELNATLERRVDERTHQLQAANAALEKAAHAKDEFLATMSHELRTPLVGVLNMAEALQTGVYGMPSDGMMRGLNTIEHSGQHLLKLINDILDLSRIELGRLELRDDRFAVGDVARASIQMVQETATKQGISVELTLLPTATDMIADYRRVQQMLVNLLGNAVKFTPAGGKVGLDIAADGEQETIRFTVWDTGIGIAADELQRIFEPFVQADSQLARRYGGAGMGLALVKRMAELHGGSVSAESQLGAGSRFSIVLPWRQPPRSLLSN